MLRLFSIFNRHYIKRSLQFAKSKRYTMGKNKDDMSRKQLRKQDRASKKRKPLRKTVVESVESTKPLVSDGSSASSARREKDTSKNRYKDLSNKSSKYVDPMIEAEERDIARLSKLLGMNSKTDKRAATSKLNKEYEMFEGFGGGFADFLNDLDNLGNRDAEKRTYVDDSDTDEDAVEMQKSRGHIIDDDEQETSDIDLDAKEDEYEDEEEEEDDDDDDDDGDEDEEDVRKQAEWDAFPEEEHDEDDDEVAEDEDEGEAEEADEGSDSYESNDESDDDDNASRGKETYQPVKGEDIYGRPLGQVEETSTKKYVPPAKRARMEAAVAEATEDAKSVRREVNGLMNRLSEQSRDTTVRALKGVFEKNSTTITNNVLKECIMATCANPTQTMTFLIPTYASVICALHFVVGVDVGAHLVENLAVTLHTALGARTDSHSLIGDKLPHNCLLLLIYMYNLRIFNHQLIFDLMELLIGTQSDTKDRLLSEMDAELLVLIFDHCGSQLRSDDPTKLRVAFDVLTAKARHASNARIQFMMDTLTDLKNNKSRRSRSEHEAEVKKLRRWLGGVKTTMGTKSSGDSSLRVGLNDLLTADTRGRWWKAGASWVGNQQENEPELKAMETSQIGHLRGDEEAQLLRIAAKMKLNTGTRKSIFLVMMSSRDVNDAFERLTKMELKGKQDREIVRVISECCGQEKTYNAFYAELATLLCSHNRQFKTTLQFSFWDSFKAFADEGFPDRRAMNLARMMSHLVCSFQLSLSIIKPLDISQLTETTILFLATFFMALFGSDVSDESFESIFDRVATTKDFAIVRDNVLVFLRRYYTGTPKGIDGDTAIKMERRRKAAVSTMEKMSVLDYRGDDE